MPDPIDFHFDYSSPYGYLASERVEVLAERHGRELVWRPILLGAVFKVSGQSPLLDQPLRGDYARHDIERSAREHGIAYRPPSRFPIGAVAASRATLWLRDGEEPERRALAVPLVHALYRAYFADDRDISDPDTVLDVAAEVGVDRDALAAALGEQSVKDALRAEVESAIERGVFGSPTFVVDGEMFWGNDRLETLERWLAAGGW